MAGVQSMVTSIWASMATWFTPTILFCFLNLTILTIFIASKFKPRQLGEHNPPQLVRVPSLLDRVRSINFSLYKFDQPDTHTIDPQDEIHGQGLEDHHVTRSVSDTCGEIPARVPAKMRKSASEKAAVVESVEEEVDRPRPATMRERKGKAAPYKEEEGVDAQADDFINKFRQQLKLQRLDSILRYKEMLGRGSGK